VFIHECVKCRGDERRALWMHEGALLAQLKGIRRRILERKSIFSVGAPRGCALGGN
jgi:hypothetical protein